MHRRTLAVVLLAGALVSFGSARADGKADCDNAMTQHDMNACAAELYAASDERLNRVYRVLIAKLDADEVAKLRQAQRAWITYRDTQCRYATRTNEGGSIYPLVWAGCLTEQTEARTKQLEAHLACVENRSGCTE